MGSPGGEWRRELNQRRQSGSICFPDTDPHLKPHFGVMRDGVVREEMEGDVREWEALAENGGGN